MQATQVGPPAMTDIEKDRVEHIDNIETNGSDVDYKSGPDDMGFTPSEQRKIIRRIDLRLVVTVGVMYCVSLMDRTNLSAANIAGMSVELDMEVGYRYSIVTLVFFITYIIFQPPSTVIVRRIGPRLHLSAICFLWGATMIGMGFSNTWNTLAGLRAILGVLEAGFFPSAVYLMSTWYVRYEMGKRYSVFYIIGCVASACSGILAYGLMQMHGLSGLTCAIGLGGYWLLVSFPDGKHKSWNFLDGREKRWVISRVQADRGDANMEAFSLKKFFRGGMDWKVWGYALIFFGTTTITYALAYFLPIILRVNMGFSIAASQCLVAPPYIFGALVMYGTGYFGDRLHLRGPIIAFNMLLCIIGLPIMGFASNSGVRYFGVFLVTAGANANVPATMSYQANNIRGQWKRAFTSASLVGFGGIGGIAGSLVFRTQDAPQYRPGMWACIACALMNLVLVCIIGVSFWRDNKKQARGEKMIESNDTDPDDPNFRYTY
ncbi:putative phthalate transporter [Diplodia seriata]|uniref:Putative phthalate transporter n=1 Tax=Diplodia seriata TaxID=420778 RepID=A0A0G2EPH8_9PEZI|nr:putative phthalate transporter [Diplodia seriata]